MQIGLARQGSNIRLGCGINLASIPASKHEFTVPETSLRQPTVLTSLHELCTSIYHPDTQITLDDLTDVGNGRLIRQE